MTMYILYSLLYIRYKIGAFSSFCSFSRLLHFVFFFCVTIMLCIFAAVWFEQHVKPSGVLICIYEVEGVCLNKGCHPTSSPLWAGAIQKKRSKVGVKASSSHPASAAVWHLCSLCVSDNLPLAYPFCVPIIQHRDFTAFHQNCGQASRGGNYLGICAVPGCFVGIFGLDTLCVPWKS